MGKQWKQWQTLFYWGPNGDCRHEIKRCLLLGRKAMSNLDSILKNRDIITFLTKQALYGQNYSFSSSHVWMCELDRREGWTLKNRCFWAVMLEKTLESPLVCKKFKPVYPKGDRFWVFIRRTDAEVEVPYFGHLMWRTDSLENPLMLGKFEDRKRRGWQRMGCLDGITDSKDMSLSKLWGMVKDREAWSVAVHGVTKNQTWLGNWKTTTCYQ